MKDQKFLETTELLERENSLIAEIDNNLAKIKAMIKSKVLQNL